MPWFWITSGLASFLVGMMYEKETERPVVDSSTGIDLSWWDKTRWLLWDLAHTGFIKRHANGGAFNKYFRQ